MGQATPPNIQSPIYNNTEMLKNSMEASSLSSFTQGSNKTTIIKGNSFTGMEKL